MTWAELEASAKAKGYEVAVEGPGREGGCCWVGIHFNGPRVAPAYIEAAGMTVGAAKRALCRAVERIREAT